jgi:hypothetical protein
LPDYICVQSGWNIVQRDNQQFLNLYTIHRIQEKVIEKWKYVCQYKMHIYSKLKAWWQRRKIKRILQKWKLFIWHKKHLLKTIVQKWKRYVSRQRFVLRIIGHVQTCAWKCIQAKKQLQFTKHVAQHWLQVTRNTKIKKWEIAKPFLQKWKSKIRGKPSRPHAKILDMQCDFQLITFLLRLLIPSLADISEHIANYHFLHISNRFVQFSLIFQGTCFSHICQEYGLQLVPDVGSLILLVKIVTKLHPSLHKFYPIAKMLRVFRRCMTRYLLLLRDLPNWLLTWEAKWLLVRAQHFADEAQSYLPTWFISRDIPKGLRDSTLWNKRPMNLEFFLMCLD